MLLEGTRPILTYLAGRNQKNSLVCVLRGGRYDQFPCENWPQDPASNLAAVRFIHENMGNASCLLEAREIALIQQDASLNQRPHSNAVFPDLP